MNKKILLVSLLAVGMLVGCGNKKKDDSKDSSTPSSSEVSENTSGNTSEDSSTTLEMGKYGPRGYYLVGDMNGWNSFWKFKGYQDFLFTKVEDKVYTLTLSITSELLASEDAAGGDSETGIDFKVMYWDGDKAPTEWFPAGVGNNGLITEAGEYKLTFNLDSTEQGTTTDGKGYTVYTKAEKLGDVNPATAFVKGDPREFDPTFGKVTFRVSVEEGLTIPDGNSLFIHTWNLLNKENEDISKEQYYKMTKDASGVWSYQTTEEIMTDDGTGVGIDYGFCIIVDKDDATVKDWTKQVKNSKSADGNYSIHVTTTKLSGTATLNISDLPYWTKGERTNPYTVDELYTIMTSDGYVSGTKYAVTGVVSKIDENNFPNKDHGSYTFWLEVPAPKTSTAAEGEEAEAPATPAYEFQIYSAKLGEGQIVPKVGSIVSVEGKSKIYTPSAEGAKPIYELAYSDGVNPTIYSVTTYSEFYVKGTMNDWGASKLYQLTENADGKYEITVNLAEGDKFKIADADWTKGKEINSSLLVVPDTLKDAFDLTESDIKVVKAGTYTFVVDASGETLSATVSAAA